MNSFRKQPGLGRCRTFALACAAVLVGAAILTGFLSDAAWRQRLTGLSTCTSIAQAAAADYIYYDILVKLTWDDVYNVDLYVTEPTGETASPFNSRTASGGEVGYYDEEGVDWTSGDSGNDKMRETYRQVHGIFGNYSIVVKYRDFDKRDDVHCDVYVILRGETDKQTVRHFGPQELGMENNIREWSAGTFTFSQLPEERPESSGCFIATAAYGSPWERNVASLCQFRDRRLMTNPAGRTFVSVYEHVSPPVARFIARHPRLKPFVRFTLTPFVWGAKLL